MTNQQQEREASGAIVAANIEDLSPEDEYQVELKDLLRDWCEKRGTKAVADYTDQPYSTMARQLSSSSPALTGPFAQNFDIWVKDQLALYETMGVRAVVDGFWLPKPPGFDPSKHTLPNQPTIQSDNIPQLAKQREESGSETKAQQGTGAQGAKSTTDSRVNKGAEEVQSGEARQGRGRFGRQNRGARNTNEGAPADAPLAGKSAREEGGSGAPALPSVVSPADSLSGEVEREEQPSMEREEQPSGDVEEQGVAQQNDIADDDEGSESQSNRLRQRSEELSQERSGRGGEATPKAPRRTGVGFEITRIGGSEAMRCKGCGNDWVCRICAADDGVNDVVESVIRYGEREEQMEVAPPGTSIHSWRKVTEYNSPWDSPDWFESESERKDLRAMFGARLGGMVEASSGETILDSGVIEPRLKEEERNEITEYGQPVAELLLDWRRLEVAHTEISRVAQRSKVRVRGQIMNALRRELLMREAVLIGRHGMTMPGYETQWDESIRNDQTESRIAEIMWLDQLISVDSQTESNLPAPLQKALAMTGVLKGILNRRLGRSDVKELAKEIESTSPDGAAPPD